MDAVLVNELFSGREDFFSCVSRISVHKLMVERSFSSVNSLFVQNRYEFFLFRNTATFKELSLINGGDLTHVLTRHIRNPIILLTLLRRPDKIHLQELPAADIPPAERGMQLQC